MREERWEPPHDPDETETRDVTFADRLATGETLSSATFTASPSGLTQVSVSAAGAIATWKFSGGTDGVDYSVVCRALTSAGNTLEQTIIVRCRSR